MKKHVLRSALIVALLISIFTSVPAAQAAPGDLDPTFAGFGASGVVNETALERVTGMAVQPDGKIVVVGYAATSVQLEVFRYLPTGRRDATFGNNGRATFVNMFSAVDVAIQRDGRIVVAGRRISNNSNKPGGRVHLARLTPEGALDKSFDGDGWVESPYEFLGLSAILVQADGMIVTCGAAFEDGRYGDFGVQRYTAGGALDTSFGGGDGVVTIQFGEDDHCQDIVQQPDGKLVVVGTRRPKGNTSADSDFAVARLYPDGAPDNGFDGDGKLTTGFGGTDNAAAVALQPDGKIVVLGPSGSSFSSLAARYLPNGVLDGTFDGDGKGTIPTDRLSELALQPDGKLVALGYHKSPNGDTTFVLYRLHPNGTLDTSFDYDGNAAYDFGGLDNGKALALLPDGRILAAGTNGTMAVLARLWPNGTTLDTGGQQTHAIVAGSAYLPGSAESGNALAVQSDGRLLVAGEVRNAAGTRSDAFLSRFLADGQIDASFGKSGTSYGYSGTINSARAIAVQSDGKIVIAGYTTGNGLTDDFLIARFHPNGYVDKEFGSNGAHRFDFAGGPDTGTAMALAPDGKIVVAGNAWNGLRQIWGIARLTTAGQPDPTFGTNGRAYVDFYGPAGATAVVVQPDGKITIGGTYNGDFFLQRLLANGARDSSFGINGGGYNYTDMGGTDAITALALAPNGWLYAAGYRIFSQNGNGDMALAQYTPEGRLASCANTTSCTNWPTGTFFLDAGMTDYAFALDLRGDNQLVAAGCSNQHFAGVQVRTDGIPTPLAFNTDFVGNTDCAKAVKFIGTSKLVMVGEQGSFPFNDTNIALARFGTAA
jgi:uncharacterized delta-60 repeat protein